MYLEGTLVGGRGLSIVGNYVGLSLVRFSRASRSKLKLTSLTSRFSTLTKNHGDSGAVLTPLLLSLASFLSTRAFIQHSSYEPVVPFSLSSSSVLMKLFLKIKTEPVTQASIIVAVVAFSSGSLASIVIYSQSSLVCVCCAIALAIVVYLALRLAPR